LINKETLGSLIKLVKSLKIVVLDVAETLDAASGGTYMHLHVFPRCNIHIQPTKRIFDNLAEIQFISPRDP